MKHTEAIKCLSDEIAMQEENLIFYRDGKNNASVQLTDDFRAEETVRLEAILADLRSAVKVLSEL